MDLRDDPSTTTTTDYDSGDSEGVDYVYEGQRCADKKTTKATSPKKRRTCKAKTRSTAKCMCRGSRDDDDADVTTAFEDDTDTEEEQRPRCRPTKPRPSGPGSSGCEERGHHRKKAVEKKAPRARSPYIEEYPDELPRPAILLKEHKIPRRFSTSDTKRARESENHSVSSGSRGRSPAGKRLPPRAPRRRSKESPKHTTRHKRRPEPRHIHEDKPSDPDNESSQSDDGEPGPATRRHVRREPGPELASAAARSSAWNDKQQPRYSSSWPLQAGSHLRRREPPRHIQDYDSEDESEGHSDDNDNFAEFAEYRRPRETRVPSFRERARDQDRPCLTRRDPPERERERVPERAIPRSRSRPRAIAGSASMATMDQGRRSARSVATSLCEVWQGRAEDWESPYPSDADGFYDSGADEPIGLLRMEDLPPRTSSPSLLPPYGERRDFGFQASHRPPPSSYAPSRYTRDPSPNPTIYRTQTWPTNPNGLFLLNGPSSVLTMEPEMMDEDDYAHGTWDGAAGWLERVETRGRTYPGPVGQQPPRSRGVSPVFSARLTREFLSPKPTRAARFDFGAWGCDRASRSSLALGLLC